MIGGIGAKNVLVRAVDPALAAAPFNILGPIADPKLAVFDSNS